MSPAFPDPLQDGICWLSSRGLRPVMGQHGVPAFSVEWEAVMGQHPVFPVGWGDSVGKASEIPAFSVWRAAMGQCWVSAFCMVQLQGVQNALLLSLQTAEHNFLQLAFRSDKQTTSLELPVSQSCPPPLSRGPSSTLPS